MAGHAHDEDDPAPGGSESLHRASASASRTITVTGTATVHAAPDEALLTFLVESDGAEPSVSMAANAAAVERVLTRLATEGATSSEMRTANVSVYAIRTYDPKTGQESLAGYRAQNSVVVRLQGSEMAAVAGRLLSAGLDAGATGVSGPAWRLRDETAVTAETLRQAALNAALKAGALAEAQGSRIGEVVTVREGSGDPMIGAGSSDVVFAKMASVGTPDVPISAGTLDVTATVTVTYSLDC